MPPSAPTPTNTPTLPFPDLVASPQTIAPAPSLGGYQVTCPTGFSRQYHSFVTTAQLRVLSDAAVKILLVIKSFANSGTGCAFPSLTTLCEVSGKSRATVVKSLKELQATGNILKRAVSRKSTTFMVVERFPIQVGRIAGTGNVLADTALAWVELVFIPNDMRKKEQLLADALARASLRLLDTDTAAQATQKVFAELRPLITDHFINKFPVVHRVSSPYLTEAQAGLPAGRFVEVSSKALASESSGAAARERNKEALRNGLSHDEVALLR